MRKHKKFYGVTLLILALLVMQIPVSEADAATSASDFQMDQTTLVKYNGTTESVSVPSNVETIGKSAFEGNSTISKVTIPASVKKIEEYAFWDCSNLETVQFGNGLMQIGDYSFANCVGLKKITIPFSIKSIGIKAFADCVNLTDVTIPPEVTEIHDNAFDGCYKLTIHAQQGSAAESFAQTFVQKQAEMPEYQDVTQYGSQTGQSEDTEVKEGEPAEDNTSSETSSSNSQSDTPQEIVLGSTQVVGNQAVVFIDNTNTGNTSRHTGTGSSEGDPFGQNQESELPVTIEKGGSLPKYTIVDQTIVADQAYYNNKKLTNVTLPEGITEIGQFAFARSNLSAVTLPEGIQTIGYGAFYHCDSLRNITLPESVQKVEPKAFEHCAWVERFLRDGSGADGDYLISGGVLVAYRGNQESIVVPEGVRVIAAEVFSGHKEIGDVTLPDSLLVVGEGAFEGCRSLKEIAGGSNITSVLDRAFAGCPLDTIRIVDTVSTIGLGAFDYTTTSKEDMSKAAVFHGTELPRVSWETSSERLSNDTSQVPSLNGILFAVVDPLVTEETLEDTVLHSSAVPFEGIICSIGQDNKLHCRFTNLSQEQLSALAIPDKAYIYGTYYDVADKGQVISLAEETAVPSPGTIQIMGTVGGADAVLEGAEKGYVLRIEETFQYEDLNQAYQRIYYQALPGGTVVYDMTLTLEDKQVPVTKLGKQAVTITIPTPAGLANQEIQVLTIDRNGQLERVDSEMVETENGSMVRFRANHFSLYAFYGKGSYHAQAQVVDGQAVLTSYGPLDASPDTGDLLHPKWFLGTGLMAAAFALLFSRNKRKVSS